jgi:hypothetical protein
METVCATLGTTATGATRALRIGMGRIAQCCAILLSTATVVGPVTKSLAAAAARATTAAQAAPAAQRRGTGRTVLCSATRIQPAAGMACARGGLGGASAPKASTAQTAGSTATPLRPVEGTADATRVACVSASRASKVLQTAPPARLGSSVMSVTLSAGHRRRAQDVAVAPATGRAHVCRSFRGSSAPSAPRIGSAESARRRVLGTRLEAAQLYQSA